MNLHLGDISNDLLKNENIYLFIKHTSYPDTAGSAHNNSKERRIEQRREEKNGLGQREKHFIQTLAIDAQVGEEEQNRKWNEEQKKETGNESPNPAPLKHLVTSYESDGLYCEPILKPSHS